MAEQKVTGTLNKDGSWVDVNGTILSDEVTKGCFKGDNVQYPAHVRVTEKEARKISVRKEVNKRRVAAAEKVEILDDIKANSRKVATTKRGRKSKTVTTVGG